MFARRLLDVTVDTLSVFTKHQPNNGCCSGSGSGGGDGCGSGGSGVVSSEGRGCRGHGSGRGGSSRCGCVGWCGERAWFTATAFMPPAFQEPTLRIVSTREMAWIFCLLALGCLQACS